ncbi:hypothetical protein HDU82_007861 [Entophlyctis luteolus]|nr:hypothetical protein HDU82_007861 [Entophlyctis luteolus]
MPLPPGWKAEWSAVAKCFVFVDSSGKYTYTDPRETSRATAGAATAPPQALHSSHTAFQPRVVATAKTRQTPHARTQQQHQADVDDAATLTNASAGPAWRTSAAAFAAEASDKRPSRYCCGCFRTRRGCLCTCGGVALAIVAALALALFFLWPRYPNITISAPFVPAGTSPVQIAHAGSQTSVALNAAVDISVYSPNYEDIFVDSLTFVGFLLDPTTAAPIKSAPVTGNTNNINFKAKRTTTFELPFSVTHSFTVADGATLADLEQSDPLLSALASACASSSGNLQLSYTVQLSIALISWTGYRPSTSGKASFACPMTVDDLATQLGLRSSTA